MRRCIADWYFKVKEMLGTAGWDGILTDKLSDLDEHARHVSLARLYNPMKNVTRTMKKIVTGDDVHSTLSL